MNNLEWLCEHDREQLLKLLDGEMDDCCICCEDGLDCTMYCNEGKYKWLLAEHVEDTDSDVSVQKCPNESCRQYADQPKREEAPECESDSRDKLEADIVETIGFWGAVFPDARVRTVLRWLDRQAAITHSIDAWNIKRLQQQLKVAQDVNERQDIEYLGQCEKIAELQKKVDALTQANGDLRDEWHRVCRERDDLQRKLHESNREREQIRKQLGIAIDHAHDMIALVSVDTDEGAE